MTVLEIRRQLRNFAVHTRVGFAFWKFLRRSSHYVGRQTQIVIDGFPRCGNSFAEAYFESFQEEKVSLAHHAHAAGQILLACDRQLPVILLIREPLSAVASCRHHGEQSVSIRVLLKEYIKFYSAVLPLQDKYVVSDFAQTIGDFGGRIGELNAQFGTKFGYGGAEHAAGERILEAMNSLSMTRMNRTPNYTSNKNYSSDRKAAFARTECDIKNSIELSTLYREAKSLYSLFR